MRRPHRLIAATAAALAATMVAAGCNAAPMASAPTPGPTAPIDARGPALLIPGYGGGGAFLEPTAAVMRAAGITTYVIDIDDGQGDLTVYADRVLAKARSLVAAGAPSVDIVGFSAGGVIARIAATSPAGQPLVRRVVTIGSPHHGTRLSSLGQALNQCPTACQQLAPDSALLAGLPKASSDQRYLSIWSTSDDVVRPPESARLEQARDLVIQDVCDRVVGHIPLMSDALAQDATIQYLANGDVPTTCVT
jgi:pimeloyl-ACP methyl ester carboxylesterase